MGQVTISLNGKSYRLECDDGEETHLTALADQIGRQIEILKERVGQVGDDRLLLMAGLVLADELHNSRRQLEELDSKLTAIMEDRASTDQLVESAQAELASQIEAAAERIQDLTDRLAQSGSQAPAD
jgi:cell division protein ZapA